MILTIKRNYFPKKWGDAVLSKIVTEFVNIIVDELWTCRVNLI
jgi:hypothetical protein